MRLTFIILGFIAAIIAIAMAILPFELIAIIPAIAAFILGLIAFSASKKAGKSTWPAKLIFFLGIIAIALTSYHAIYSENNIKIDSDFIKKEKASEEEAIDELEDLEGLE